MIDLTSILPYEIAGPEITKIAKAATNYWSEIETKIAILFESERSALTCHEVTLDSFAWQRRITRFPAEELDLYRKRVDNAFFNRRESGSTKGLKDLFIRFGVADFQILERLETEDPDTVVINIPELSLSQSTDTFLKALQEFGLTCRRYYFVVSDFAQVETAIFEFNNNHTTESCQV